MKGFLMKTISQIDNFFSCIDKYDKKKDEIRKAFFELQLLEYDAKQKLDNMLKQCMSFNKASSIVKKYKRYGFSDNDVKNVVNSIIDICIKPRNENKDWFNKTRCISISIDSLTKYHLRFSFVCNDHDGYFDLLVPIRNKMQHSIDEFESTNYGLYLVVAHMPVIKTMMLHNNENTNENEIANNFFANKIVAKSFSSTIVPLAIDKFMNDEFTNEMLASIINDDKHRHLFFKKDNYSYSLSSNKLFESFFQSDMPSQSVDDFMHDAIYGNALVVKEKNEIKNIMTDYASYAKSRIFEDEK